MIELKSLCAGYHGTEVLHRIDTVFRDGSLIGIVGPMGSGKSTLIKAISAIIPHSGGEILIDGRPVAVHSRTEIAKRIAYLAQNRLVPDMTVLQTVLHGRYPHLGFPRRYRDCDYRIAEDAMQRLGIGDLSDKQMSVLSGGMRQTVYLAMALAQDTQHILLDEPTTHLDITHQITLMRHLRAQADGGRCIISVMHDLPMALTFSDRILVMEHGRVAADGTPDEICASGVFSSVFGVSVRCDNGEYGFNLRNIT